MPPIQINPAELTPASSDEENSSPQATPSESPETTPAKESKPAEPKTETPNPETTPLQTVDGETPTFNLDQENQEQ